jgi:thioredoxin 1
MKRRSFVILLSFLVLLACKGIAGAGATSAPLSTPELKQTIQAGKKTVVFFINPNGGPCRAQNEILQKLHKDRNGTFSIAYVSTLKQEDQKAFYDYGIRSLPSLVLVDKSGKIGKVFPPGIQSYDTLTRALDSLK